MQGPLANLAGRKMLAGVPSGSAATSILAKRELPQLDTKSTGFFAQAKGKTLVDRGNFGGHGEEELMARRIVVESVQDKLAKNPDVQKLASDHPVAKLAAGKLDHAYVGKEAFDVLAKDASAGNAKNVLGNPKKYPVFVDARQGLLVVNIDHAFSHGDSLAAGAKTGIANMLRDAGLKIGDSAWAPAEGPKTDAKAAPKSAKSAQSGRSLKAVEPQEEPQYFPNAKGAHPLTRLNRPQRFVYGSQYFKSNQHHGIENLEEELAQHRGEFTHPHDYNEVNAKGGIPKEILVHRGLVDNRHGIPENSIAAIDNAYRKGYFGIEIDVQVAADGVPVLMHDFTAGRMTADVKNDLVSHIKSDDILKRDLIIRNPQDGNYLITDQKVPSVEQALRHVLKNNPGMTINLDCKEATPEIVVALLLDHPEFRPMTAVKLYGRTYFGGYDQMLGALMKHYGIDPKSDKDAGARQQLRQKLESVNLVPILSQGFLKDPQLIKFFPPSSGRTDPAKMSADDLAEIGLKWLHSWKAMKPVIFEVVQTEPGTPEGEAMGMIRQKLREPDSPFAKVPFSGSYRYEDFSSQRKDGSVERVTWNVHGGMGVVPEDEITRKRETAGAFRHEADTLLTDQPDEEVWANLHDQEIDRGHSGFELNQKPGTSIDFNQNKANVKMRVSQFLADKPKIDEKLIDDVRAGLAKDNDQVTSPGIFGPEG